MVNEKLLTAAHVAALLDVSLPRVYELARVGVIPSVRLGRQLRFDPRLLEEWVRDGGRGLSKGSKEGAAE